MVRTLAAQVKEYKKASILTPTFVIFEVIMELFIPLLIAKIIDDGIGKGNSTLVYKVGLLMAVLAILSLLFGVLNGKYAAMASAGMATDVTNVQNAYQMILRLCTRAHMMLIIAVIMSISISPKLSLIFVVAIVFLGTFLAVIGLSAHKIFTSVLKKYDDVNASVQENVNAIHLLIQEQRDLCKKVWINL